MFVRNLRLQFNYFLFETSPAKKCAVVTRRFLGTYLILLLLDYRTAVHLYTMNDHILFQVFFGFVAIMNLEALAMILTRAFWGFTSKKIHQGYELSPTPPQQVPMLDGCRLDELIPHITEHNGLPTKETREAFGLSHDQIKKLWDNLERVGIFTRGKNNARVLATRDYDMIIRVMKQASDSDKLPTTPWDDSQPSYTMNDVKTALATG